MAEESVFREAIVFLEQVGMYDIILPFLLVFTIVFAILEKTKILGVGKDGVTKKNINAIVAFVMAFLVIASTQLVSAINEALASVVLLLILIISFMLLVGTLHTGEKEFSLEQFPGWIKFFMYISFIGIVLIFLNALGWLDSLFSGAQNMNMEWVSSLIFLLILGAFIWFITRDSGSGSSKKPEKSED